MKFSSGLFQVWGLPPPSPLNTQIKHNFLGERPSKFKSPHHFIAAGVGAGLLRCGRAVRLQDSAGEEHRLDTARFHLQVLNQPRAENLCTPRQYEYMLLCAFRRCSDATTCSTPSSPLLGNRTWSAPTSRTPRG